MTLLQFCIHILNTLFFIVFILIFEDLVKSKHNTSLVTSAGIVIMTVYTLILYIILRLHVKQSKCHSWKICVSFNHDSRSLNLILLSRFAFIYVFTSMAAEFWLISRCDNCSRWINLKYLKLIYVQLFYFLNFWVALQSLWSSSLPAFWHWYI